ncbi:MAG: nucleotidyltransferase domain-containing protein [Parcubacteria group bacterium]|nr:nucleotidyltransferase domain-containing protein [Parcubacteria group bacterium]
MSPKVKKLIPLFALYPSIKLVYFFGSRARGEEGPLSDYDFAVYTDGLSSKKISELKIELIGKISLILKTDDVDVVMLNITKNSELKYNIIQEGVLIFEREPYKIIVEPKILNEYFDFYYLIKKNNLTKA